MSSHYPLLPQTIEKISAAQTPVAVTLLSQKAAIQSAIDCAMVWRVYCFGAGKLGHARTTAVMIGRKRSELRQLIAQLSQ